MRRSGTLATGEVFERYGTGLVNSITYNDRNELLAFFSYVGNDPHNIDNNAQKLADRSRYYLYDPIGNRRSADFWNNSYIN